MKTWLTILSLLALAPAGFAGDITGTVRAEPKPGTEPEGASDKYGSRKYKFAERVNYAELRDFVVYIQGPVGGKAAAPAKPLVVDTRRVAQKAAQFTPHVLPVVAGTVVEWPNNDEIYHNVFSASDAKQFDLELYKGNPPDKRVLFDKPGRVDVFCSIHANMHCVVLVLENPYFAVADERGRFSITNVPPGTYQLKAWHERVPAQIREITVPETGDVKTDFVLSVNNLPKY
jgi:plastocyanin